MPIITHGDLDGFVSALLCMKMFSIPPKRIYTSSYSPDRDEFWKKILSDGIGRSGHLRSNTEVIWFLDMGLRKGELEWARNKHKQAFWHWVDHHQTSEQYDPDGIFHETYVTTDGSVCASDIMWDLYKGMRKADASVECWVEAAHDRDLWINKNRERNVKLDMVIKAAVREKNGFRNLLDQVWVNEYSPTDILLIRSDVWSESMKEFKKSVEMAQKSAEVSTIRAVQAKVGYPVKICYCAQYASDVAEELYETGDEIIVMIQLIGTDVVVSLRTKRDDVNIADLCEAVFSGGGHPQAGGGRLNEKHMRGGYIAIVRDIKKFLGIVPQPKSTPKKRVKK